MVAQNRKDAITGIKRSEEVTQAKDGFRFMGYKIAGQHKEIWFQFTGALGGAGNDGQRGVGQKMEIAQLNNLKSFQRRM